MGLTVFKMEFYHFDNTSITMMKNSKFLYSVEIVDDNGRYEFSNGLKFKTDKFGLISTTRHGGYRYETSHIRYYYDIVPKKFRASFIAKANREGLVPSFGKRIELSKRTLSDQIEYGKNISRKSAIFFWSLWTVLIIIVNVGFIALDNRYLNS